MMRAVTLIFCGMLWTATTAPAHSHAVLIDTQPADGVVLSEAPREILLRFNESVAPVRVRVIGGDGRAVAEDSAVKAQDNLIRIALPAPLPSGTYIASFRVISIDSHPVSGSLRFSVGAGSQSLAPQEAGQGESTLRAAVAAARALYLFAVLFATGGILALWRVRGFAFADEERPFLLAAGITALALGAVLLGLTGCRLLGIPFSALASAGPWQVAIASSLGQSLMTAGAGLTVMLLALVSINRPAAPMIAVAGALMTIASFGLTGHAATASPAWLMGPAVTLHALCAAFWLGSLHPLLQTLRKESPARALAVFNRFSAQAGIAVALIVVLGVVILLVQVPQLPMLFGTPYGLVLLGKIFVASLLLAVAAHNRWRLTPVLAKDPAAANRGLGRAILGEYGLFAVILALTAALGQLEPPRTLIARGSLAPVMGTAEFKASVTENGYTVTLQVAPALTGHSAILAEVKDTNGTPITPKEVVFELSLPSEGIEPIRRQAAREESGHFVYHSDDMVRPGRWRINVHVLIDDFTKRIAPFEVPIR